MYRLSVLFIGAQLIFIGMACSGSKSGVQTNGSTETITSPLEYSVREERVGQTLLVKFNWKNTSSRPIYFDNPYQYIVFSASDLNQDLPIRDCPCNAPCAPRPIALELAPGESFELNWDMFLTTCIPTAEGNDLISERSKAPKGNYQIRIHIRAEGEADFQALDYPFNLL